MHHVTITGARGFLGWHTRAAAIDVGVESRGVILGTGFDREATSGALSGASRLLHLAGVNRGTDDEVRKGNEFFARQLSDALVRTEQAPPMVIFANSIQSANGSVYGDAKSASSDILRAAAERVGSVYIDLQLPNLFGEHGRPFYNAVTSTFSHLLATGATPTVDQDRELALLHAQDAADVLLGLVAPDAIAELVSRESVAGLLGRLSGMAETYNRGEIPDVSTKFNRDLFNTYRSYTFPAQTPVLLTRHADARGSFFEIIRSHGGCGQSSFSTTAPGISRGDHFHRRKIERFTVLSGTAVISLRKLFSGGVFEFAVTGDAPSAVDMPTMWSHKITNTGTEALYTSFWANDIFDPAAPDTISEAV